MIPAGATTVPAYAFYNWDIPTSVEMPSSVTSIGNSALYDCKNLTSVKMPSVTSIGRDAFKQCESLTSVKMPSVIACDADAFKDCKRLTSVDIGSSITKLFSTFHMCSNLKSVVIRAVEPPQIDNWTFNRCDALTEIIVPAASEATYKEKW